MGERFSLKSDGDIFGVRDLSEASANAPSIRTLNLPSTGGSGSSNEGLNMGLPTVVGALPKLKQDLALNMKQLAAREERLSYLEIIMDLMRENQKIRAKLEAANASLRNVTNGNHVSGLPPSPQTARRTQSWP